MPKSHLANLPRECTTARCPELLCDSDRFCPRCGASTNPINPAAPSTWPWWLDIPVISLAILAVFTIITLIAIDVGKSAGS